MHQGVTWNDRNNNKNVTFWNVGGAWGGGRGCTLQTLQVVPQLDKTAVVASDVCDSAESLTEKKDEIKNITGRHLGSPSY